jgi:hypothetical protein
MTYCENSPGSCSMKLFNAIKHFLRHRQNQLVFEYASLYLHGDNGVAGNNVASTYVTCTNVNVTNVGGTNAIGNNVSGTNVRLGPEIVSKQAAKRDSGTACSKKI